MRPCDHFTLHALAVFVMLPAATAQYLHTNSKQIHSQPSRRTFSCALPVAAAGFSFVVMFFRYFYLVIALAFMVLGMRQHTLSISTRTIAIIRFSLNPTPFLFILFIRKIHRCSPPLCRSSGTISPRGRNNAVTTGRRF